MYRADGVKLKKLFGDIETNYLDGFQYKSTKPSETSAGGGIGVDDPEEIAEIKLRMMPTSEGYYDFLSNEYIYNYTDHLGNVRLSYSDSNKDGAIQPRRYFYQQCSGPWDPFNPPICIDSYKPGEIVEVNNYYPFGLLHNYTGTTQNAYQYKYNGKELQETGMYDYGARFYMPEIGRWGVVDPLAEASRRFSPYVYGNNNPIRFIDPDGRLSQSTIQSMLASPSGTTWYNTGSGFASDRGDRPIDYEGNPIWESNYGGIAQSTGLGSMGEGGGGSPTFEIGIYGKFAQAAFDLLKESMKGQLNLTFKDGMVSGSAVEGVELSEAATTLLEAIKNPDIKVRLETVFGFRYYDANLKTDVFSLGDAFKGSFVYNGKITATNIVSPKITEEFDKFLNSEKGVSFLHAALEAYIGALHFPGKDRNTAYDYSHAEAARIDSRYKDLPSNYIQGGSVQRNTQGRVISETVFFRDINTNKIIIDFGTIKY